MAEQDIPDRKSQIEKAEGDRDTVAANMTEDRDEGSGITNRPLDEERDGRDPVMPENDETLRTDI